METLPEQFREALSLIEISADKVAKVKAAHEEVRRQLEGADQLADWGVDTILIGSYSRHTGISPGKDVDVFTKLPRLDTSASADVVFRELREVLSDVYGNRAKPQRRSVKIEGFDGFHVDAVPAVLDGDHWAIPDRELRQWVTTDPERLGSLTTERNRSPTIGDQGAYVPLVKLIRQVRSHHLGDGAPGGLYFEILTYDAFEGGVEGSSFAELLARTLFSIAGRLESVSSEPLVEPALGQVFEPQPSSAEIEHCKAKLSELAGAATSALQANRCQAAAKWRRILGSNDRGPCFPLPPGCDEKGQERTPITVNPNRGSDEGRSFG